MEREGSERILEMSSKQPPCSTNITGEPTSGPDSPYRVKTFSKMKYVKLPLRSAQRAQAVPWTWMTGSTKSRPWSREMMPLPPENLWSSHQRACVTQPHSVIPLWTSPTRNSVEMCLVSCYVSTSQHPPFCLLVLNPKIPTLWPFTEKALY